MVALVDPLLAAVAGALAGVLVYPLRSFGVGDDTRKAVTGLVAPLAGVVVELLDAPVITGDALRGDILTGLVLGLVGAGLLHVGATYLSGQAQQSPPSDTPAGKPAA